jgi:hypothetical protein
MKKLKHVACHHCGTQARVLWAKKDELAPGHYADGLLALPPVQSPGLTHQGRARGCRLRRGRVRGAHGRETAARCSPNRHGNRKAKARRVGGSMGRGKDQLIWSCPASVDSLSS